EVVRDLDILRALLGEEDLDFYGASYGTQIGATYAAMFGDNVGSMVLDGAVDLSLNKQEQSRGQVEGLDRALRQYLATVGDVDEGIASIVDLLASLDDTPMDTQADRVLTKTDAIYAIAYGFYDKKSWPLLTTALER